MNLENFQRDFETLFAGESEPFNKELCTFMEHTFCKSSDVEDFFQLNPTTIGQQSPKKEFIQFIFRHMGHEETLIHVITSFLAGSSYNPLTKNRQIRSVEWTLLLAKRFQHLHSEKLESSFHAILFAHSTIRLFRNLKYVEAIDTTSSTDQSITLYDVLMDDDSKGKSQARYKLCHQINHFIKSYKLNNICLADLPSPLKIPMFAAPRPHQKTGVFVNGAYNHRFFSESVSDQMQLGILGKVVGEEKSKNFDSNRIPALQFGDASKALKSINMVQQTPWMYNTTMLNFIQRIQRPKPVSEDEQKRKLREEIYITSIDNLTQLCSKINSTHLFYPWYFDYRGRIYCSKIQYSYMGEGLPRSLHLFAESEKVTGEGESILLEYARAKFAIPASLEFTLADLKKAMGKDTPSQASEFFEVLGLKGSKKIRFDFLEKQVHELLQVLGNPEPERTFRKERWSILSTLLEFEHYWSNDQEWRLPLALDATCNGQQHISAIAKDEKNAKLTRLFESDSDVDLYEYIVDLTRKRLTSNPEFATHDLDQHDLHSHLNRQNLKGIIMKLGYGARTITMLNDLISNPLVFPLSLWEGKRATKTEEKEAANKYHLLPKKPSSKDRKAEYFYAPWWAAKNSKDEHLKQIKKQGYYVAEKQYLKPVSVEIQYEDEGMEEQIRIERAEQIEAFENQFSSQLMNYDEALEEQRERLKIDVNTTKRVKIIKLLSKCIGEVCKEELLLKELNHHLENIYDGYVAMHPQSLTEPDEWFSYSSSAAGTKVSFVALKGIPGFNKKQEAMLRIKDRYNDKTTQICTLQKQQGYSNVGEYFKGARQIKYLSVDPGHPKKGTINLKLRINELKEKKRMQQKWLPSYIHNLDATHLHLIVNKWDAEGLGPIVTIHDSFGMHPNSVQRFREIARETFIELHKAEPLRQFYQQCGVEVPDDYPTNPEFDLEKVGLNMFSF